MVELDLHHGDAMVGMITAGSNRYIPVTVCMQRLLFRFGEIGIVAEDEAGVFREFEIAETYTAFPEMYERHSLFR